jgi:hypothetical protein
MYPPRCLESSVRTPRARLACVYAEGIAMRWLRAIGWTVAGVAGAAFLLAYVNDADLRAALYWPLLVGVLALLVFDAIEHGSRRRARRIEDLERRVATLEGRRGSL